MADEITLTISRLITNGYFKETLSPGAVTITQTTQGGFSDIISCSTTLTEVTFGSVSSYGRMYVRNLDGTNYVDLYASTSGSTTVVPFSRCQPTEPQDFRAYPGMRLWTQIGTSTTAKLHVSLLAG